MENDTCLGREMGRKKQTKVLSTRSEVFLYSVQFIAYTWLAHGLHMALKLAGSAKVTCPILQMQKTKA